MALEYKSLEEVLSTIEVKGGLNKDNIIEELKTKLEKQDQDLYLKWEKGEFDLNYVFDPLLSGEKFTLLMIAAENGHTNIVKVLLEKGADVNVRDHNANTVLYLAIRNGYEGVVEILLKKGADVNEKGWLDRTPLQLAAENGNENVVNALIRAGANVNEKNVNDFTALHLATGNGNENVVNALITAGANVNAADEYGKIPVDYAKSKNVVKALLEAGGGSFVKASRKGKIAGGVTILLGTAIAVALFTTGTIAAQLIPIVIAVVAVTAAALVVGCATYALLKPSTKVDGAEKSSAVFNKK